MCQPRCHRPRSALTGLTSATHRRHKGRLLIIKRNLRSGGPAGGGGESIECKAKVSGHLLFYLAEEIYFGNKIIKTNVKTVTSALCRSI
jgi:hypothetical protein